jgi:hypothetical protein
MIGMQTDNYIRACMKTWLLCESCLHAEADSRSPRKMLMNIYKECAAACVALVSRLVSNNTGIDQLAFNCLIRCRECQEECIRQADSDDMIYCSDVCGYCAETVGVLTNTLMSAN